MNTQQSQHGIVMRAPDRFAAERLVVAELAGGLCSQLDSRMKKRVGIDLIPSYRRTRNLAKTEAKNHLKAVTR